MTDSEYTGIDPEPIFRRIMAMRVPDGNVLAKNIFISDNLLAEHISNIHKWDGVTPKTRLINKYAEKLRNMS
jgi:hypothetical protein